MLGYAMIINTKKVVTIARLLRRSFRKYSGIFLAMVGLGLVGGLAEGLGIATVIPLFSVVTGETIAGTGFVTRFVTAVFGFLHISLTAPLLLGFMVLLFIGKGAIQFSVQYVTARIVAGFERDVRTTLLQRTMHAGWAYLLRQKAGYLESILLYDVERSSTALSIVSSTIILCTTFAAYIVVALSISPLITVITLAVGGLIFLILKPIFWRIRRFQATTAGLQRSMVGYVSEHMASMKSLKAMALEHPVITQGAELFSNLRKAKLRTALVRKSSIAFIEPTGFLVIAALFLFNWHTPGFSIVSFAVVIYLVQKMFNYISAISGQLQDINEAYPHLQAVMDWQRYTREHAESIEGLRKFSFTRELAFNHVSFAYRANRPILNDLSLVVPRGQLIGLIGPSGVGKTTVVDLLLRLFSPNSGHITTDGMDIAEIHPHTWRRHIGYVPQDALLLNTSVRDNIRFYSDVSDADIERAARDANIHEAIMKLPHQYDTSVGERGVFLSGGQRQRIILARALVRKPDILILDEATSAIDAESERLVREAIAALRGRTTVIVITHNLTTAENLDRLVVLENGTIREDATPQELMDREGSYLARLLAR